jgi:hypothetical protein
MNLDKWKDLKLTSNNDTNACLGSSTLFRPKYKLIINKFTKQNKTR